MNDRGNYFQSLDYVSVISDDIDDYFIIFVRTFSSPIVLCGLPEKSFSVSLSLSLSSSLSFSL
jgi:hypothetical protein